MLTRTTWLASHSYTNHRNPTEHHHHLYCIPCSTIRFLSTAWRYVDSKLSFHKELAGGRIRVHYTMTLLWCFLFPEQFLATIQIQRWILSLIQDTCLLQKLKHAWCIYEPHTVALAATWLSPLQAQIFCVLLFQRSVCWSLNEEPTHKTVLYFTMKIFRDPHPGDLPKMTPQIYLFPKPGENNLHVRSQKCGRKWNWGIATHFPIFKIVFGGFSNIYIKYIF